MNETKTLQRIHEYEHWCANQVFREARVFPSVVLYEGTVFEPDLRLIMPRGGTAGPSGPTREQLAVAIRASGGSPQISFMAELFPALATSLQASGFHCSNRQSLLACTPTSLISPPVPAGFSLQEVSHRSPIEAVQLSIDINAHGFDRFTGPADPETAERFRQSLAEARVFVARLDGVPVAGGMYQSPWDGVTRLDGIATLAQYRRRGLAAALTAAMTAHAFARGVSLAYLTTGNPAAERVYTRLGYRVVGTLLEFDLMPDSDSAASASSQ